MKRMSLLLLVLTLCLCSAFGLADDVYDLEDDLLDQLLIARSYGWTDISYRVTEDLLDRLSANEFEGLSILEVKSGMASASVRYADNGEILFNNIEWTPSLYWTVCTTREELRQAILYFCEAGTSSYTLICSGNVFQDALQNSLIYAYGAQGNLDYLELSYQEHLKVFNIANASYSDLAYTVVANEEEYLDAIEHYASLHAAAFRLVFDPDAYRDIVLADETALNRLQGLSVIDTCTYVQQDSYCRVEYSGVTYDESPRLVCATEDSIVSAFSQMAAENKTSFRLVLTQKLFSELSVQDFAPLHRLESAAKMTNATLSYSTERYLLIYEDVSFDQDAEVLKSLTEVRDTLFRETAELKDQISLFCTADLYEVLLDQGDDGKDESPLYDMVTACGVFAFSMRFSPVMHLIQLDITEYYPGTRIAWAVMNDRKSILTSRELAALDVAQNIVRLSQADTPVGIAKNLHDRLCDLVIYADIENSDDDDTALGALLFGMANCDGYADAFYLLGTLAGLEVRYQHGDTVHDDMEPQSESTHMWNLLKLQGEWCMIDVTWDDDQDSISDTWFCLGADRASRTHLWNETVSLPLTPITDLSLRPSDEYWILDTDSMQRAVKDAYTRRLTRFDLYFESGEVAQSYMQAEEALLQLVPSGFSYRWNPHMLMLSFRDIKP